jgi:hypothetical protein
MYALTMMMPILTLADAYDCRCHALFHSVCCASCVPGTFALASQPLNLLCEALILSPLYNLQIKDIQNENKNSKMQIPSAYHSRIPWPIPYTASFIPSRNSIFSRITRIVLHPFFDASFCMSPFSTLGTKYRGCQLLHPCVRTHRGIRYLKNLREAAAAEETPRAGEVMYAIIQR